MRKFMVYIHQKLRVTPWHSVSLRGIFLFFVLFITAAVLSAQTTAEEIETLLRTNAVTYAQAARFVLEASEALVTSNSEEAFRYAAERNWLPKKASVNEQARLDGISLLLMRSFDLKGGLFYSLFKNPHYAYRELSYRNVIQGRADPGMDVSGERLLFLTGRILSQMDDVATLEAERIAAQEARLAEERARIAAEEERLAAEEARRLQEEADREALARRTALSEEINEMLEEQHVADADAGVTEGGVMITLSNIQFPADSAVLPESEKLKLREIAVILKDIPPDSRIQVAGHSALAGTKEEQLIISLERAQAVAAYLALIGAFDADRITAVGYGAEFPIADNSTERGMAANRRVEIKILEN